MIVSRIVLTTVAALATVVLSSNFAQSQQRMPGVFPEQRWLDVRTPEQIRSYPVPEITLPFTIADQTDSRQEQRISLDEAIQIAVVNANVIRVLTGIAASSSGRTIYDVAIANTAIDVQTSVFDPRFDITSTMNKTDRPGAIFDPFDPSQAITVGSSTDFFNTTASLSKLMLDGGTVGLNANTISSYFEPGVQPLEPEFRSFVDLALRQPLMRGFGRDANLTPVIVARIDTERSYFQFKDSVQVLVRSVIAAYWNLVASRIDVWARLQQIKQAEFANERAAARLQQGLARAADVAQARSALANFRASLITARANMLLAETVLRNILELEPSSTQVLVPTSLPVLEQVDFDWDGVLAIAEQYRPDIIELKLILEADAQLLIQADNQARPQLDGIANYRWDGLSGEMPNGNQLPYEPGRFAGFSLGVNFSVPLGLRQGRASLRRRELLIARDQANLDQGIHQMVHQLTINYRNLDQFFQQYIAFKEAREAARLNFENQIEEVRADRREFINALQAITDWGNAVSAEARSITQYNTELADIERESGTILETHGIRFYEERFSSLGPVGLMGLRRTNACYSSNIRPEGSTDRYTESNDTSDDAFKLEDLDYQRESDRQQMEKGPDQNPLPPAFEIPSPEIPPGDGANTAGPGDVSRSRSERPRPGDAANTAGPTDRVSRADPVAPKRKRLLDYLR